MVNSMDQRLLDTNAMALGSGVGLAALEAMFNLVQTQSSLGAAMVKQHDTSHNAALLSLAQVLEAGVDGAARSAPAPGAGLDALVAVLKDKSTPVGAVLPTQIGAPESMDQHLSELLELLREHLADILKTSKSVLAVT